MRQSISDPSHETAAPKQARKKSGGHVFLILFLVIFSLGFGIPGVGMIRSAYRKEQSYSAETEGRVVGYHDYSRENKHMFSPIIEYLADDQMFTGETNVNFNHRPFKEGESISIYYNPQKPEEFYIKGYDLKTTYQLGGLFLFVSIGVLMVSALILVLKERFQLVILMTFLLLFFFLVFSCLVGPGKTLAFFAVMGLFILYGIRRDKRSASESSRKDP